MAFSVYETPQARLPWRSGSGGHVGAFGGGLAGDEERLGVAEIDVDRVAFTDTVEVVVGHVGDQRLAAGELEAHPRQPAERRYALDHRCNIAVPGHDVHIVWTHERGSRRSLVQMRGPRDPDRAEMDMAANHLPVEDVRGANETGDERCCGLVVDLARRARLLDATF